MPDSSSEAYEAFVAKAPEPHQEVLRQLVDSLASAFPELERVMAWNIVHFRRGSEYVLGIDVLKKALWLHPFNHDVLLSFQKRLGGYHVTSRSFQLPIVGGPDIELVHDIVSWCLDRMPPASP